MTSAMQHSSKETRRTGEAVPTLQERKQQVVRDAIWDAATDLFTEKGFNETTVDDIVQAAGVSRRSFFRYFESKNDLMAYAMVNYGAELIAAIDACPEDCSLSELLRETVTQVAERAAARPRSPKILAIVSKYADARVAQASRLVEVQDLVTQSLARRCRKAGEDKLAPSILAGLIVELAGLTVQWWYEHGQRNISDAVDQTLATAGRILSGSCRASGSRRTAQK